jgi:hypothetical protein
VGPPRQHEVVLNLRPSITPVTVSPAVTPSPSSLRLNARPFLPRATPIRPPRRPPPSPFSPPARDAAQRKQSLVGDRGLCELVRPIPPSPVSPSSPPLPYPIRHDLAHLLIQLMCSNLQQIDALARTRSFTDARPSPAASPLRPRKKSTTQATQVNSPSPSAPRP